MDSRKFWPYILMMPSEYPERIAFIKDVLASKIAANVLPCFEVSGSVLQKDLIKNLSHSNKSIIQYLEVLRSYGFIETGSKVMDGRRIVYHELTKRGWVLVRFFSEGLPPDANELTEALLEDYLTGLLSFYREHNFEESVFFEILTRVRAKSMVESSKKYEKPEFVILGASALFTNLECELESKSGIEIQCKMPQRFAGGPSLELASSLAGKDTKVVFVSTIGDDLNGWSVLTSLIAKGIDVHHFVIESTKATNETIMLHDGTTSRVLVGIDERFALSLTSPSQIPWNVLEKCKLVYIGEVFLEVALAIAVFCHAKGIPCVFRCSQHYWRLGLSKITSILNQIDVLLVSPAEWAVAKEELGLNPVAALRKHTNAEILIKMDKGKYGLLAKDSDMLELMTLSDSSHNLDPSFVTELLKSYMGSRNLEDSFHSCKAS